MKMLVIEDKGQDHHHHHYYHHYHKHGNENSPDHDYNRGNSHSYNHIPKNLYNHDGRMDQYHLSHMPHQQPDDNHGKLFRERPTLKQEHGQNNVYGQDLFGESYNDKQQHYADNQNPQRDDPHRGNNYEIDDFTAHQQLHDIAIAHDSNYGKRLRDSNSKYHPNEKEGQSYQSSFRNEAARYATGNNNYMLGYGGFMFNRVKSSSQYNDDTSYRNEESQERKYDGRNSFPFLTDITLLPITGLQFSLFNSKNK